jgi:methylmalonyl-CoA mutase N-terminal domain/subunit
MKRWHCQRPTQRRLALRTQQIIAWESGIANTVDPVGGSEAIEMMTREIERQVFGLLDGVDSRGGMLAAIETGWVQSQIQESAYSYQRAIETGGRIVVGVNQFATREKESVPTHSSDPDLERDQVARPRRNAFAS